MTLQEILKSQGLTDEQIKTVVGEMKQNKIFTAGEENLDIRYAKLKADHDSLTAQHGESTRLIEQMKKEAGTSAALQEKITSYEATIGQLQEQLQAAKLEAAIKVALIGAKTTDVEYMAWQLRRKGELTLDDQGNIKDIDDKLAGLKTQFPQMFEAASRMEVQVQKLPDQKQESGMTRKEFLRKPYAERAAFAAENPEAYQTIMNN